MAVYKPTLCHPFGGGLDVRIAPRGTDAEGNDLITPLGYLTCRVETSNVPITGYSVAIYTADHELLFPKQELWETWSNGKAPYISPLREIQDPNLVPEYDGSAGGVNSGENGSILKIPFFRPWTMRQTASGASRNAVYYRGYYVVHHILMDPTTMAWGTAGGVGYTQAAWENAANWGTSGTAVPVGGYLTYSGTIPANQPIEIDQEPLIQGDLVAVLYGTADDQTKRGGIYQVRLDNSEVKLYRLAPWNEECQIVSVWQGQVQHGTNWYIHNGRGDYDIPEEWHKALWWANTGGDTEGLSINALGTQYQWEVTLYQGKTATGSVPIETNTTLGDYIKMSDLADLWWDNTVTAGQILGSNSERLQLSDDEEKFLPQGTDADPVILQDTYCAVYSGTPGTTAMAQVSRFHVAAHSITLGHVSPAADTTANISSGDHCSFYEHSQDPAQILDTDIVDYVYTSNISLGKSAVIDGQWSDYSTTEAWYKTSVTERYWTSGAPASLGTILLTAQNNPKENGVWQVGTMTAVGNAYSWIQTADPHDDDGPEFIPVPQWIEDPIDGCRPDPHYNDGSYQYSGAGYVMSGVHPEVAGYVGYGHIVKPTGDEPITPPSTGSWASPSQTPAKAGNQTRYYLRRAAGYNSWATFIGRIIYANAPVGGNYTSLAYASGATLWDPNSLTGQYGAGRLWIKPERPILLFRNKLKTDGDFLGSVCILDKVNNYDAASGAPAANTAYGDYCQPGEYLADASGTIWYIKTKTVNNQAVTWTLSQAATVTSGDYIWVERVVWTQNGALIADDSRGQTVWKRGASSWGTEPSWDLHRAKILKNSTTETYISPWVESMITERTAMTLQSPGSVKIGSKVTTLVRLTGQNTVTYKVTHAELSEAMPSLTTPWNYEIRSFFRTSDPNPFVSYEAPYLRLQASGRDLATKATGSGMGYTTYLWRSEVNNSANYSAWPLNGEYSDQPMPYLAQEWERLPALGMRYWHLRAYYPPLSGGHWTAYQWRLLDDAGKLLQDSGRKYDGLIDATFYGLANDALEDMVYTAELTVENTFNDILCYRIRFTIGEDTGVTSDWALVSPGDEAIFSAAYDCVNQAMILTYQPGASARGSTYSIYRREYDVSLDPTFQGSSVYPEENYRVYCGLWEPVILQREYGGSIDLLRDFNVVNGKSYQYVLYPNDSNPDQERVVTTQIFANYLAPVWQIDPEFRTGEKTMGTPGTSQYDGMPALVQGADCWSMVELEPIDYDPYIPLIRGAYRVNNDNIWLFRFNVETGEQVQNLGRSEFQSLGQYARFGYGRANYISGTVSAQLGSEIVCTSKYKYIERLPKARIRPLSTNEKAEMLLQWRRFMASRNPKLLRDIKGQSWLVQVMGPSNTPKNYYPNTPDTISFQWKAIGSPNCAIIYGEYSTQDQAIAAAVHDPVWPSAFDPAFDVNPTPAQWVWQDGNALYIDRYWTDAIDQDGTQLKVDNQRPAQ